MTKKKALATVRQPRDGTPSSYPSEHWITALTTLPYTDLLASGMHMAKIVVLLMYIGYISHALNFRILTTCPNIKTDEM